MKRIDVCLVVLVCAMAAPLVAAQDAAIEAKEGDVEHWIEYYKKERGLSNEIVTQEQGTQQSAPQGASESEGSGVSTQPATPNRDD